MCIAYGDSVLWPLSDHSGRRHEVSTHESPQAIFENTEATDVVAERNHCQQSEDSQRHEVRMAALRVMRNMTELRTFVVYDLLWHFLAEGSIDILQHEV